MGEVRLECRQKSPKEMRKVKPLLLLAPTFGNVCKNWPKKRGVGGQWYLVEAKLLLAINPLLNTWRAQESRCKLKPNVFMDYIQRANFGVFCLSVVYRERVKKKKKFQTSFTS